MYLILIIGMTGQGKSKYLNNLMGNRAVPFAPGRDKYYPTERSKKQYIFDVNNEYVFPVDTAGIKPIMRNVSCDHLQFINNIRRLNNYNIVFEDATGFLRGAQSPEMAKLMVQKRHSG